MVDNQPPTDGPVLRASLVSSGPLIAGGAVRWGKTFAMRAFLLADPAAVLGAHALDVPVLSVREGDQR